jgi:hypothetical protein
MLLMPLMRMTPGFWMPAEESVHASKVKDRNREANP